MASVAETLINDYMQRRATESRQSTMNTLGSLGSPVAPTDYTMNANSFIGGMNQGIDNLVRFAQTGDRNRAAAAEQARLDEATAYTRERQAASDALAARTSDLAQAQFDYRRSRDLRADQEAQERDQARARTANAQLGYMDLEDAYRRTLGEAEPYMNQAMNFGILGSNTGSGLTLGQINRSTYDAYAQAVEDGGSGVAPLGFEEWQTRAGEVATALEPMLVNIQEQQQGLQIYRDDFTRRRLQGAATADTSDDYIGDIQSIGRQGDIARNRELQERIALLDGRAQALTDELGASSNLSTGFADWRSQYRNTEDRIQAASRQYDDGEGNETSREFAAQTRENIRLLENNPIAAGLSPLQLEYLAIRGTQDAVREGNLDPTYFGAIDGERALNRTQYYIQEYIAQSRMAQDTDRRLSNINNTRAALMALANQYGDIYSPMTR